MPELKTEGGKGSIDYEVGLQCRVNGNPEFRGRKHSRVHLVASLLKRWLLGTQQGAVRASHVDYYLDEFTFRFNRRTSRSRGRLFYRLMEHAVAMEPVKFRELRGGRNAPQPAGST